MPKRRADADHRRFFDDFPSVRVSRFRANGTIDPARRQAVIPFPDGTNKLIGTAHTRLKYGGGWSYFICPKCAKLAQTLYLIESKPLCRRCCEALNIQHRSRHGFGRQERMRSADLSLDRLITKLETPERLSLRPAPKSWRGKAKLVYRSRRLTERMRRRMITLRLSQLADQHESERATHGDNLKTYQAIAATKQLISLEPIWRASSTERLQQALDQAQRTIIAALNSDDPKQRLAAAKLMMRTKQARDRGSLG